MRRRDLCHAASPRTERLARRAGRRRASGPLVREAARLLRWGSGVTGAGPSGGARAVPHVPSLWDGDAPVGAVGQLVHRARLLAANPAVTHRRCGSVSTKGTVGDDLHEGLWIAGAGRDLLTLDAADVAGLDMARLLPLQECATLADAALADTLDGCRLGRLTVAPPAEALLHAFVPAPHVDRTCPDAVAMLACARNGEQLAHACFGDELAWIPSAPPGFALAQAVGRAAAAPGVRCALIAHQGLVTWGETSEECYARTIEAANRAADFISAQTHGPRFGGPAFTPLSDERRAPLLSALLPVLRTVLGGEEPLAMQVDTSPRVRELACSRDGAVLAQAGPAIMGHVPHTGRTPLWIELDPWHDDVTSIAARVAQGVARRHALEVPQIVLVAGVGLIAVGATAAQAQLARDVYGRTIEAIAGASSIDVLAPLPAAADPPT